MFSFFDGSISLDVLNVGLESKSPDERMVFPGSHQAFRLLFLHVNTFHLASLIETLLAFFFQATSGLFHKFSSNSLK